MDVLELMEQGNLAVCKYHEKDSGDYYTKEPEATGKILELAKLGKQMQWVGVAHKPPKINEHVIVFHEDDCKIAYISTSRNWRSSDNGSGLYGTIKYWMPLPPNPGEGE
jgi:hypothetical protein